LHAAFTWLQRFYVILMLLLVCCASAAAGAGAVYHINAGHGRQPACTLGGKFAAAIHTVMTSLTTKQLGTVMGQTHA
jgi:hypothetical protein